MRALLLTRPVKVFSVLLIYLFLLKNEVAAWNTLDGSPPLLIAHRGEKVLLPEHTLPAYRLAAILGADYVEPDLCLTKDNQFVCHHDIFVSLYNTDVGNHPEFDHLKQNTAEGFKWFIRNFTLQELQTLHVTQKSAGIRPKEFNGLFKIPSFQEFLELIHDMNYQLNRSIGIAPELKDPPFHNSEYSFNLMEDLLLKILKKNGYSVIENNPENCTSGNASVKCPPVLIQSFHLPALEYLRSRINNKTELAMLVEDEVALLTYQGIEKVSKIANQFYIWKEILHVGIEALKSNTTFNKDAMRFLGGLVPPQDLPKTVHEHGMKIGIYTIYDSREESHRKEQPVGFTKQDELFYYFRLGVDGIFVENVAESREILRNFQLDDCKKGDSATNEVSIFMLITCFVVLSFSS